MAPQLRNEDGRFLARRCSDPNCDGSLVPDTETSWDGTSRPIYRCDGLTHIGRHGALFACPVSFPALHSPKEKPHVQ